MNFFIALLLIALPVFAQAPSGRQLGFAGASDVLEANSDVLHGNPAALARPSLQRWRIDLPRFSGGAANNAFSVGFWNDQVAQDHYLTANDKDAILDRIPEEGLRVSGLVSAPLVGGVYRKAAMQPSEETAFHVTADRELFELVLYGNQLNRGYRLEDLGGEQYMLIDAGAAVGYRFEQEYIKGLYGGLGFHFYIGHFFDKVVDATGELSTTDSLLQGYGAIQRVHATSGDGIGFDVGLLGEINEQWAVGLALKQIGGSVTWVVDEATLDAFAIDSTGLIVDSLDDQDYVSRSFERTTSVVTGGSIESTIPVTLEMSGRYDYSRRSLFLGTLRARFDDSAQGERGAELSIGGEYKAVGPMLVRAGLGAGGPLQTRYALGLGVRTSRYDFDFGASWHNGLFSAARGISLGISHSLHW
ncbi:MAG: hypothetical protein IPG71_08540 [bacterium]|nr:hypothetical protein [bacterium]